MHTQQQPTVASAKVIHVTEVCAITSDHDLSMGQNPVLPGARPAQRAARGVARSRCGSMA
jgi:hypothetical protein